jgi:hypothetical protein
MTYSIYFLCLLVVMFYGFQWYAGALQSYPRMAFVPRMATLALVGVFGLLDIVFMNLIVGIFIYRDAPFQKIPHGTRWHHRQWTFSQRTEYWYNQSHNDWQKTYLLGADNWAALLNAISPGHITLYPQQ